MIAIDSSGLKCYGQDEWVREKYGEISEKRNWRKLHISVDQYNIIQIYKNNPSSFYLNVYVYFSSLIF